MRYDCTMIRLLVLSICNKFVCNFTSFGIAGEGGGR